MPTPNADAHAYLLPPLLIPTLPACRQSLPKRGHTQKTSTKKKVRQTTPPQKGTGMGARGTRRHFVSLHYIRLAIGIDKHLHLPRVHHVGLAPCLSPLPPFGAFERALLNRSQSHRRIRLPLRVFLLVNAVGQEGTSHPTFFPLANARPLNSFVPPCEYFAAAQQTCLTTAKPSTGSIPAAFLARRCPRNTRLSTLPESPLLSPPSELAFMHDQHAARDRRGSEAKQRV